MSISETIITVTSGMSSRFIVTFQFSPASSQRIIALTIAHLGMSLTRMGRQTESVRVLDDVDLTFSLSLENKASRQFTDIQIDVRTVVFRVSYRDIMLMSAIVNNAIALFPKSGVNQQQRPTKQAVFNNAASGVMSRTAKTTGARSSVGGRAFSGATLIVSTEKVR